MVVMILLVINLQCFNGFLSLSDHQGSVPSSKGRVPNNKDIQAFGADRDFADTGQGVPNPPSIP